MCDFNLLYLGIGVEVFCLMTEEVAKEQVSSIRYRNVSTVCITVLTLTCLQSFFLLLFLFELLGIISKYSELSSVDFFYCLFICLFIYLFIFLFFYLFICLLFFIYLIIYVHIFLINLSLYLLSLLFYSFYFYYV
jgi:hypothetical protein